jgi:hypothetical protein
MRFHGRLLDTHLAPQFMVFKRRVISLYNLYQSAKKTLPSEYQAGYPIQVYDHILETAEYWVQMRIQDEDVYVTMMASGSMYFEFQTSGFPVDMGTYSIFDAYYSAVVSVNVSARPPKGKLQGTGKTLVTATISPLYRANQVQLHDELNGHTTKIGTKYPRTLYESFAPITSHTGIYGRAYHCGWLPFGYSTQLSSGIANQTRDIGYDNPWADSYGKAKVRYAFLAGTTDWPRACGIQLVKDTVFGDVEFAIYVDSFDQVSVFPTSIIGPQVGTDVIYGTDIQNVPAVYVQTQRVPFPSWVYKKTQKFKDYYAAPPGSDSIGLADFPEIDWKVHPDGTEMCAVVHEREAAVLDNAFFGTYATDTGTQGPSDMFPTDASFYLMNTEAMGCYQRLNGQKPSTSSDPWYMVATGLLQVKIEIKRTGLLIEQYSLTLTVTETRRPTTTPYCTFVAGYAFHTIKDIKKSTTEKPVFHAHRGDLMALDIECYGNTSTGDAANLFSLKNITQEGREVNAFGAMNTRFESVAGIGTLLTGQESVVFASDMRTLSFAVRTATNIFDDISKNHETVHFGLAIIVMNKYQETLYPKTIPDSAKAIIADANACDVRARMEAQLPNMSLMPLNDLRTWGDTDLDSLRESYVWTSAKHGTYSPPIQPLNNFDHIQTVGYKFYRNGARLTATPTAAAQTWYDDLMTQGGIKSFPIFDLDNPRPGWYLYMGQVISRLYQSPYTAFFTHPDSSWAIYDQQMVYNGNGMYRDGSPAGPGYLSCDPARLEHCIFDKVHFATTMQRPTWNTSFLKLYNQAVKKYVIDAGDPTKNLRTLAEDYSDIKITFTVNGIADTIDAALTYAEIQMNWYPGFTCYYVERWYWSGTRNFGTGFESQTGGGFQLFSLGQYAQLTSGAASSVPPIANSTPVKFSSAVLIDP